MTAKKNHACERYIPKAVSDLVKKLGMEPDRWTCWTVECGLHSGIPPCCIAFYALAWVRKSLYLTEPSKYSGFLRANDPKHRIGYIPCPACVLSGNIVKLKPCDCHRKRAYPLLHRKSRSTCHHDHACALSGNVKRKPCHRKRAYPLLHRKSRSTCHHA